MLVYKGNTKSKKVRIFQRPRCILDRLTALILKGINEYGIELSRKNMEFQPEIFSTHRAPYGKWLNRQLPICDLINLHWVAEFVDYYSFFRFTSSKIPVVWTLHDMNPFTGGCHYDDGCSRFVDGCGSCPKLGSNKLYDLSRRVWLRKKKIFDEIPSGYLYFVSPSKWLAQEAAKSPLINRFPIRVIPNGLNTEIFSPKDKSIAREALGIPGEAKVVLFVAASLEERRKGIFFLREAIKSLHDMPGLLTVSVGQGDSENAQTNHLYLGEVWSERVLSIIYSIADLFITTSLQDNLPNTIMEALACGTPVVAFNVGGIPEMVRHMETGYLARYKDVEDLARGINTLLSDPDLHSKISKRCREVAVKEYSSDLQTERYIDLYSEIITNKA